MGFVAAGAFLPPATVDLAAVGFAAARLGRFLLLA